MDEDALIAAAQGGDRNAFNQLVVHYQDLAYNVAYRVLGDPDGAADATQDAFLSAFRAIARFRGGSFRSWLLRIVTNACYDQLRVKQRRPTVSLDADPELDWEEWTEDEGELPDEFAERSELSRAIQDGLGSLPDEQRVILVLSDIQGMAYKDIARTLGLSLGTVKSRLNRGRGKLRDYLQSHAELLPARYRLQDEGGGAFGVARLVLEWVADLLPARWFRWGADNFE
ncbi:MAG: sigma-70 family RNA polymerase sigma factor [Anaerolineae bacterium]|nr:sigma-70 family RNA polymerase sigma factor [Anaerolineae bacterium]